MGNRDFDGLPDINDLVNLILGSNHEDYLKEFIMGDLHDNTTQVNLLQYQNSKTGQILYMSERDSLTANPDWERQ